MSTFLLTMQYNESLCLPQFLRHYGRYVASDRTFIVDHGSGADLVPPGCNRIRVPRDRPYSEAARTRLIKHLAAGLLEYFDAGIYVDCDELIDLDGLADIDLQRTSVAYVAGFDVCWHETAGRRRLLGYLSPHLCKASIFSRTPNWMLGFHGCDVEPSTLALPMAHIRFLFEGDSLRRARERIEVHRSMHAAERSQGIAAQWGAGEAECREFHRFMAERIAAGARIRPFVPLDCARMYRRLEHGRSEDRAHQVLFAPNGFSPVAGDLFDLTEHFPTLLESRGGGDVRAHEAS